MARLHIDQVSKIYTGTQRAVDTVSIDVDDGEFLVLVGPSGCGKSTLLRMIAGLEAITEGAITIGERVVNDLDPAERDIAMVFQNYALYPHMKVYDNMAYGLRNRGIARDEIDRRVREAATTLELGPLLERKPRELSGGQRQRVAMGRAIVRNPAAFLFDEPLSNLDAALRVEMRLEIAKLHRRLDATMVYVTHDQVEAMTLADKIVVLQAGRIEQVGAPIDLYMRPANLFVAQFIGSPKMNVADCQPAEGGLAFANGQAMSLPGADAAARKIGIRPEHITLAPPEESDVTGVIDVIEQLGSDTFVYVEVDKVGLFTVRLVGHVEMTEGEPAGLRFDRDHIHLFGADDRALAP
ncbi:MAG: sn-glycerol-3-phosphate ABC transporter ATP-binding protein UgpC [Nitratireductor sp.]|uniref:ABC transporter ATP-binding protein n=1 Tax=Bauldia litoralis TaxID=665467 RepID=UPI0032990A3E